MATHKQYHRTPRYVQIATNDAAILQQRAVSLQEWINSNGDAPEDLKSLFQKKIDLQVKLSDVNDEIIKYWEDKQLKKGE